MFKVFYRDRLTRQRGTMASYRTLLTRTNVTGQVKGKFEAHDDFACTVTEALIVQVALRELGMDTIDSKPTTVSLPENAKRMHLSNKEKWTKVVIDKVVSKMLKPFQLHPVPQPKKLHMTITMQRCHPSHL